MFRSLVALAFRKISKSIFYSFIAIGGLVVGLTTAILVFIWAQYELTYDRYDESNERVYALMINELVEGTIETYDETPVPLLEKLSSEIPEVEAATRFDNTRAQLAFGSTSVLKYGAYADSSYFTVFAPTIEAGDATNPLPDNQSIAISRGLEKLLFADERALGKTITVAPNKDYKVSVVFSDFPVNSSLNHYSFILPFNSKVRDEEDWENYFVRLISPSAKEMVESKINVAIHEFMQDKNSNSLLFPLTDWRLHWNFENGKVSGGRIVYVVIFVVTAIFILIMACVNYVNLATASAAQRSREIGVRKMTGATQNAVAQQFLLESFVMTSVAMLISLLVAYSILPLFNQLTGNPLVFNLDDPILIIGILVTLTLTTLLAGSYPAFLLSGIRPALVLKGNMNSVLTGAKLRKALVIFQFSLSIILIFSAFVMMKQTEFLLTKDLGYDKANVINVWLPGEERLPLQTIKSEIEQHSSVVATGLGGASPMEINGSAQAKFPGKSNQGEVLLNGVSTDHKMLETLKFDFVLGRNFLPSDSSSFVVTESVVKKLGLVDPIGQRMTYTMFGEQEGEIIGVVKDFQNEDIHAPMDPVIFVMTSEKYLTNLFVRYNEGQLDNALTHIKKTFNKFQPGMAVDISFLDSDFQNQFFRERLIAKFSLWFTIIALVIAALGLVGLTIFNTQRRTKEIGVRKVLGASVPQIVLMLWRDFLLPITLSFVIAFPIAFMLMNRFLEGYAYRIALSGLLFFTVAVLMIAFVLISVSFQSIRAARANPVKSLKGTE